MSTPDAEPLMNAAEIEKLKKQLLADRKSKAFIPLAEEYVRAGMLREAVLVLEDGLKEYPTFITALVALGRVCVQLDDIPRATAVLQEAVKISPDNVMAHRMLARLHVKSQAWEAAGRSCDMVLFGYPKDEEMLALKTEIARHLGQDAASPPSHEAGVRPQRQPGGAAKPGPAQATPARTPSSPAALFGAAAEPPPALANEAAAAAHATRTSPPSSGKAARLQHLLARVQARRAS